MNGHLYKGICKDNEKEYALKHIMFKQYITPTELEKIAKEINIQHQVSLKTGYTTPFINEGYLLFITDKLGKTLERYFTESGVTSKNMNGVKQILSVCFDIIKNLAIKHKMIHGDEHFNNFMLTEDFSEENFHPGMVKIIDFGETYVNDKIKVKTYLKTIADVMIVMIRRFNPDAEVPENMNKYASGKDIKFLKALQSIESFHKKFKV
jgi:hypothetical protein